MQSLILDLSNITISISYIKLTSVPVALAQPTHTWPTLKRQDDSDELLHTTIIPFDSFANNFIDTWSVKLKS